MLNSFYEAVKLVALGLHDLSKMVLPSVRDMGRWKARSSPWSNVEGVHLYLLDVFAMIGSVKWLTVNMTRATMNATDMRTSKHILHMKV